MGDKIFIPYKYASTPFTLWIRMNSRWYNDVKVICQFQPKENLKENLKENSIYGFKYDIPDTGKYCYTLTFIKRDTQPYSGYFLFIKSSGACHCESHKKIRLLYEIVPVENYDDIKDNLNESQD